MSSWRVLTLKNADGDYAGSLNKSIWVSIAYVDGTDTDATEVSGAVDGGWLPIGGTFTLAVFEGNDNTISNLYINRTGY